MPCVHVPSWLTFPCRLKHRYCNALCICKYTFLKMKRKVEEKGLIWAPVLLVFILGLMRQSGNCVSTECGHRRFCFSYVGLQALPGFWNFLQLFFYFWLPKMKTGLGRTENLCSSSFPTFKLWKFAVRLARLHLLSCQQIRCLLLLFSVKDGLLGPISVCGDREALWQFQKKTSLEFKYRI